MENFLSWLRSTIFYIIFWIITVIAAFEAGILYEFKGIDSSTKRLTKVEIAVSELAGKVTAHDAVLKGMSKGRVPQ